MSNGINCKVSSSESKLAQSLLKMIKVIELYKLRSTTIEVKTTVNPGYIKIIEQVKAECDGNDSYADWFKITDVEGKSRKIVNVTYEKTLKDDKPMTKSSTLIKSTIENVESYGLRIVE